MPATRRRARTTFVRSEEHTSELQSRGLISYAVFCLKKQIRRHAARLPLEDPGLRPSPLPSGCAGYRYAIMPVSPPCAVCRAASLAILFFFIMTPPPQISTLFPPPPPSR